MKKLRKVIALIIAVVISVLPLSACTGDGGKTDELQFSTVYAAAVDLGFNGTLGELIEAFKGDSAYAIAVSKGYTGSETEWLTSLKGANGTDGITPSIGANGNWFIGSTDTGVKAKGEDGKDGSDGADGKSAYEIWLENGNTGSEADFLAWLKGQNGTNGSNGKSAYEIWLENGNEGSDADFLAWLKGQDGANGANGKSAYEIWLENGNEGSEADFLAWLKGQDGANGTNGTDGEDGKDGASAYEIFIKHNPDYLGNEAQWISDFVAGRLVRFTVTFTAAGSEDIVKSVFYGYDLTDIPEVPEKAGNTGEWDRTDFTNITENIIVTAEYKTIGLTFAAINGGTEYAVTESNLTSDVKVLVVPSENEGKPVTTIGYRAFANNTYLTHVTVPKSVTVIEREAFDGCNSIVEMTVPFVGESKTGINNTKIGYLFGEFVPNSLKSVIITDAAFIGDEAFKSCYYIEDITMLGGVTSIGKYAFAYCSELKSVVIPESVKFIGAYAFHDCADLENVMLPSGMISINDSVFGRCVRLTSLTLPDGVTSIGSEAFKGCEKLETLVIPDSVSFIGDDAFGGCNSLRYEVYNGSLKYLNNVLMGTTNTVFTAAELKVTTTLIYNGAFSDCGGLTSIVIPNGVKAIGKQAFINCGNLKSVTIGDGVISIGSEALKGCGKLETIVIPDSVTFIGGDAFVGCDSLQYEIYGGSLKYLNNVLMGTVSTDITDASLKPDTTIIYESALSGCSLTSVVIPDCVTQLGARAFKGCESITSVTIPDSVTLIGRSAFDGCRKLKSIVIGSSVTVIEEFAFFSTSALTDVYYKGTENMWNEINIAYPHPEDYLGRAARYYYSEIRPSDGGKYWRYDENDKISVW